MTTEIHPNKNTQTHFVIWRSYSNGQIYTTSCIFQWTFHYIFTF